MDADEWSDIQHDDLGEWNSWRQLHSSGAVCRYQQSGFVVLQRSQYLETADDGHQRFGDTCGRKHLDWLQQPFGWTVAATGIDGGGLTFRIGEPGQGFHGNGCGNQRELLDRRRFSSGVVPG